MKCGSSGSGDDSEKDSRSECSALGMAVESSIMDISGSHTRSILPAAVQREIFDYDARCFALEESASRASRALEGSLPML